MRYTESKEETVVRLLNNYIDRLNKDGEHEFSDDELASLSEEEEEELHSLISVDRLLRIVSSADRVKEDSPVA